MDGFLATSVVPELELGPSLSLLGLPLPLAASLSVELSAAAGRPSLSPRPLPLPLPRAFPFAAIACAGAASEDGAFEAAGELPRLLAVLAAAPSAVPEGSVSGAFSEVPDRVRAGAASALCCLAGLLDASAFAMAWEGAADETTLGEGPATEAPNSNPSGEDAASAFLRAPLFARADVGVVSVGGAVSDVFVALPAEDPATDCAFEDFESFVRRGLLEPVLCAGVADERTSLGETWRSSALESFGSFPAARGRCLAFAFGEADLSLAPGRAEPVVPEGSLAKVPGREPDDGAGDTVACLEPAGSLDLGLRFGFGRDVASASLAACGEASAGVATDGGTNAVLELEYPGEAKV